MSNRMGKMKKVFALMVVLAMVFSLSACGSSDKSGGEATPPSEDTTATSGDTAAPADDTVYKLDAGFIPQAGTETIKSYEYIAGVLKDKSNGRIEMNVFPGGQIGGSDTENAEAVSQNIFQMTTAPTHTIAQYSGFKEYSATTIPFLFTAPDQVNTYVDSDMMKAVNESFTEKTGLKIFGGFCDGFMGVATANTPFVAPQDIAGLKIRTQDAKQYIDTFTELGISAVPMSAGEIFTALEQGTIDGISGISMMITNEHYYEILKHYADVNAFANYHMIMVNNEWYTSLPDDLKTIFDEAMAELVVYMRDHVTGFIEETYKICEDNGMTVTRLTDEQRQVWIDNSKKTYDAMKAEVGADIVSQIEEIVK